MHAVHAIPLLVALAIAAPAAAGSDLCLLDDTNDFTFVLKRPRLPKRAGDATPVTGFAKGPLFGNATPAYGSLLLDPYLGSPILALTLHYPRCIVSVILLNLEEPLQGNVTYDCNLDGAADSGSVLVDTVACPSFPLP